MKIMSKGLFVLGIILSVVIGILVPNSSKVMGIPIITAGIIIIGFIVGIINLKNTKTNNFLITTITLLAIGNAGLLTSGGEMLSVMMLNILAFVGPAALLVSVKAVYEMVA